MNNKGFTLVELLGVITLISLIALIIVPAVSKTINKGADASDKQVIENIKLAAENWALDNKEKLPGSVTVGELKNGGYIDRDLKVPSTKKNINDSSCVSIMPINQNSKIYKYEFKENCN